MIQSKQILTVTGLTLLLSLPLTPSFAEDSIDIDEMLLELDQQMQLGKERLEKLNPELRATLEEKSDAFSKSLDSALDEGLIELEKLGKKYDSATAEAGRKFDELLKSEEMQGLKEYLTNLDKEAVSEARDELVDEFIAFLELSAEQIEALKPLLREKLERLGEILNRYLVEGKDKFEQFRAEFEAESRKDIEQYRAILDSKQVEKLETQLESIQETIRVNVFEV